MPGLVMSAGDFPPLVVPGARWGAPIEQERRKRILVAHAAFAYEIKDDPFMSDADWDRWAQSINPRVGTCHPIVDEFFATQFSPMTGMWVRNHPELDKLEALYWRYKQTVRDLSKGRR